MATRPALLLLSLVLVLPLAAQDEEMKPSAVETSLPKPVITEHRIDLNPGSLDYLVETGYMPMRDEEGSLKAKIFFMAYTRKDAGEASQRPITFAFNGGPGSSSVWLHLGALGPKRVLMSDEGELLPPPYQLVDNPDTWLTFTDLVFIDPVMTGYSRPAPGEEKGQFHGVEEDVESVAEFIRVYATTRRRWSSPKFIAGESYGTTRAAGLSGQLQQRHGMYLSGLMLVSSVLNFQTLRFRVGNDLPYLLYLPTYTATAWYHGKLPRDLQRLKVEEAIERARRYALSEYALALLQGSDLSRGKRRETADELAKFTGLSREYILRSDLRVPIMRFVKELLRSEGRSVGRLDSRFKGIDRDSAGESFEYDSSYSAIQGPYTAMLNAYVREDLGYENDIPYEILGGRVQPWNWGSSSRGYTNVAETLRGAMSRNPHLHVFVANGYYDLATPFFATEYTFTHLGGDPALRQRVDMAYYPSGHMMYIHKPSLRQLKLDVERFVERTLAQESPEHVQGN